MHVTVYVLALLPVLLARLDTIAARALVPAAAARVLTGVAVLGALAGVSALVALAIGGLGRINEFAALTRPDLARPDPTVLHAVDPVPRTVGALAAVALLIGLVRVTAVAVRRVRGHRSLAALRRAPAAGDLVVLDCGDPQAFTVPGRPGRIVVSAGMLGALDADGRRTVLAHERAHLRHHHARYLLAVQLAAALNPLVIRVRDHVEFLLERWADEHAAVEVGDRDVAARALARAALAAHPQPSGPAAALGLLRLRVLTRVRALHAAAPTSRWTASWPAAALTALTLLVAGDTAAALSRCLHALYP